MKNYIIFAISLIFVGGVSLGLGSCNKKGDTIAKIFVRDTSGALVSGARIILYGTSTEVPVKSVIRRDTAYTNAAGVAIFNYNDVYQTGQAGVAVLDIDARKDDLTGKGIIKIVEEEENIAKVLIQP